MRAAALLVLLLACAGRASAQERPLDWDETPETLSARYTADLPAGVSENGNGMGTMRDSQMDVAYRSRLAVTDRLTAVLGVGYRRTDLFLTGGAPLPSALQSLNAHVGAEWKFNDRWRAGATVSPGVYGDTDLDRGGDFKVPVSMTARYSDRPGLVLLGGFAVGLYGRRGVTPTVGAIWQIDEKWRLNATAPLARLTYTAARDKDGTIDLFGAAGYDGGRYQVSPDFGNRFNKPELDSNTLAVQQGDARLGVSAGRRSLRGELAVGEQFARRYIYEQASETFHVGAAAYLSASLIARF